MQPGHSSCLLKLISEGSVPPPDINTDERWCRNINQGPVPPPAHFVLFVYNTLTIRAMSDALMRNERSQSTVGTLFIIVCVCVCV